MITNLEIKFMLKGIGSVQCQSSSSRYQARRTSLVL